MFLLRHNAWNLLYTCGYRFSPFRNQLGVKHSQVCLLAGPSSKSCRAFPPFKGPQYQRKLVFCQSLSAVASTCIASLTLSCTNKNPFTKHFLQPAEHDLHVAVTLLCSVWAHVLTNYFALFPFTWGRILLHGTIASLSKQWRGWFIDSAWNAPLCCRDRWSDTCLYLRMWEASASPTD